eukprot:TRINITY_DN6048_c0_g1_i4.p1 TRINITY_DN6048_c0_g1~~TRINITY_DN6048_c0_g1_i4.p1  ORF type:complete len:375 (+),score=71.69 TRINITY_DN6048_c0_g1_i4:3-1127(+)
MEIVNLVSDSEDFETWEQQETEEEEENDEVISKGGTQNWDNQVVQSVKNQQYQNNDKDNKNTEREVLKVGSEVKRRVHDEGYVREAVCKQVDAELEQAAEEVRQLCEKSRNKRQKMITKEQNDENKILWQQHVDKLAEQMSLFSGAVTLDSLKQALHATKQAAVGDEWQSNWILAAQIHIANQLTQEQEMQQMKEAMQKSLEEHKSVEEMSMEQLLEFYDGKSVLLDGIIKVVGRSLFIGKQMGADKNGSSSSCGKQLREELRIALVKILGLEKSCYKWYYINRGVVETYFQSLVKEVSSKWKKKSAKRIESAEVSTLTNIMQDWHKVLTNSVVEFEHAELDFKKKYRLPKVFKKLLKAYKKVQSSEQNLIVID